VREVQPAVQLAQVELTLVQVHLHVLVHALRVPTLVVEVVGAQLVPVENIL